MEVCMIDCFIYYEQHVKIDVHRFVHLMCQKKTNFSWNHILKCHDYCNFTNQTPMRNSNYTYDVG